MKCCMRPLAPQAPEPGQYATAHMGDQPMRHAPKVLFYGKIRRGLPWAFAPPRLQPKNLVTGQPTANG